MDAGLTRTRWRSDGVPVVRGRGSCTEGPAVCPIAATGKPSTSPSRQPRTLCGSSIRALSWALG